MSAATKFLKSIAATGENLRERIELAVDAFSPNAAARDERRARAMDPDAGFAFFRRTYFPHYHEKPDSKLHAALETQLPAMARDERGRREVVVAPRGSAKTTLCSLEYPLWLIVADLKRFVVVCSDSSTQAELMLDAIKAECETNPRLRYDFPELMPGDVWRADHVEIGRAAVMAKGRGKKVRGLRHGPRRPDLFVLDDIENDENVQSPDQRDKTEAWIDKAVMKAGKADGSLDLLFVGTVLHFDAVLPRKARKAGWGVTRFEAILRWPTRMDLWERFAELVQNGEGDDHADALAFHAANRAVMDDGATVVWPEMQPLVQLMTEWAEDPDAFMSERQNEPIARDAMFKTFTHWVRRDPDLVTFGAIDPSLGKAGHGRDPSAILVGGFDRASGRLDVIEASIRRRLPDTIIGDTIAMQQRHRCQLWFVESVQFQEFLRTQIMVEAARRGVALPTVPVVPIADKRLRIERLQPPVAAGLIRLHEDQRVLIDQLRQFPNAAHDDGPDCLEMLWTNALHHAATAITSGLQVGRVSPRGPGVMGGYRLGR